jgi:probable DNA metabolism protein
MPLRRVALAEGADLAGFRHAVRVLLAAEVAPEDVVWSVGQAPSLLGDDLAGEAPPIALPRTVANLIGLVVCHRDPERYALLYRFVWRLLHGEPALPVIHSDPLVHRIAQMGKTIRRDLHKMHAFLRFRRVDEEDGAERFIAWFEPGHFIVEATAEFFVARFRAMVWSILTPVGSLHWDRERLVVGPPGARGDAPEGDGFEAGWCGYYESIFNPARVNPTAMRAEMAKKYWHNMPEAAGIPELVRSAPARMREMIEREAAAPRKRSPDKAVARMFDA